MTEFVNIFLMQVYLVSKHDLTYNVLSRTLDAIVSMYLHSCRPFSLSVGILGMSGLHSWTGREFHRCGPAAAKVLSP